MLQYGPILAVLNFSLDINYSSRFVQYPHYPIACCLPHLSTVAHNCHGKSINLTAKRKTHSTDNNLTVRQKEKYLWQKEKPHGKKKKTQSKKKTSRQKEKRLTTKFL